MSRKIAIINDISGYGRCSTSVILPIVSHLGVQGCALPTAIFSNHTGFPSFFCQDFTGSMQAYINEWKKLDLQFDGIMTGFLGSARQISIVQDFITSFRTPQTHVLIDPVMGDNGRMYPTYTEKLCREMKRLIAYADIVTPNLTEACFLTGTPYKEGGWKVREIDDMVHKLADMGARNVVITGLKMGGCIGNALATQGGATSFQRQTQVEQTRSGTGDVFAAILGADAVNGVEFATSVKRASRFVRQSLIETLKTETAHNTGIDFECTLDKLKRK
ncbi:MAG: pyridoxamine kinase [Bacteroidales bacterium]|nr:pyridoxamine kinase [Candidatus Liminaster caballi]